MCDLCLKSPCASGCPNTMEPDPVETCKRCGFGIYDGEEYAEIDGEFYCESCIDSMPYSELVTLLGGFWRIARGNNGGW